MNLPFSTTDELVSFVIRIVCEHYNITTDQIMIRTRKYAISRPRQEIFCLLHEYINSIQIAQIFKSKGLQIDDGTIRDSYLLVHDCIDIYDDVRERILGFRNRIKEKFPDLKVFTQDRLHKHLQVA